MATIQADIDALRATLNALRQGSSSIENAFAQATQAMTALQSGPWAGNHRQQVEAAWERIRSQYTTLCETLGQLTRRTEQFTNALEEAGSRFGDGSSAGRNISGSERMTPIPETPATPPETAPEPTPAPATGALPPILNERIRLSNGSEILVSQLDGRTPVAGMDSIYGKPGQLPLDAPITSTPGNRHPELYAAVINQFGVAGNPRYASDNYTYCNTFAGDVMRAMGVPLPTKTELGTGVPGDRATVNATDLNRWLTTQASAHGWREVDPSTPEGFRLLKEHVNAGKPALASDPGHVAVIRPGQHGDSVADLRIAQAGGMNINDVRLGNAGLGSSFRPRYFIHE